SLDDGGKNRAVIPLPYQRGHFLVLGSHAAELLQHLGFGKWRPQIERYSLSDRVRHGLVDQIVDACGADRSQHLHQVRRRGSNMTGSEVIAVNDFKEVRLRACRHYELSP